MSKYFFSILLRFYSRFHDSSGYFNIELPIQRNDAAFLAQITPMESKNSKRACKNKRESCRDSSSQSWQISIICGAFTMNDVPWQNYDKNNLISFLNPFYFFLDQIFCADR